MSDQRRFCTFYLDDQLVGIDVHDVLEIVPSGDITRVPLAPPEVEGLINLRGQIVTAIDLRRRLGLPARGPGMQPVNVIVRTADGPVSLLVDETGDVLEVHENDFEDAPGTVPENIRALIEGIYMQPDKLLLVLSSKTSVELTGPENYAPDDAV